MKAGTLVSAVCFLAMATSARAADSIVPSAPHPLQDKINVFLRRQAAIEEFKPTGLTREDYLRVIGGQVKAMRRYQNADGRIIDPVEKIEKYYATPCYAHCVAVLAASGHNTDAGLIESGMKAMDVSVADMAGAKAAGGHGDFYTWPLMLAYESFRPLSPPQRAGAWRKKLQQIDPAVAEIPGRRAVYRIMAE